MQLGRLYVGLVVLPVIYLAGCQTLSLKEFSPLDGQPKTAFIDIKQRAVLTAVRKIELNRPSELIYCAEPSPDAISSIATQFASDTKYKEILAATLAFGQQETGAFVGLRTQTIQLLRDGMFRLCEGYLGGALSSADFSWLSRRYQRNMVALLTIEQLTRVAQTPAIGLSGQSMASAARSAAAIQADIEQLEKDRSRLQGERERIEADKAEVDKTSEADEKAKKLKEIQERLDNISVALKRVEDVRSALLAGLETARGVLVNGSTTAQLLAASVDDRQRVSDAVAKAIASIAERVLDQDDLPTLCFQLLDGSRKTTGLDHRLADSCILAIESRVNLDVQRTEILKQIDVQKLLLLPSGKADTNKNADQISDALKKWIEDLGDRDPRMTNIPNIKNRLREIDPSLILAPG